MDSNTLVYLAFIVLVLLFVAKRLHKKSVKAAPSVNTHPPIWPPRRPDDFGREIQEKHQKEVIKFQRMSVALSGSGLATQLTPPVMPLIPSWEAHHKAEQARDPLQVRWAQTESGDWHRVVWGNRALAKAGKPTPVFQSMQRTDTGEWVWIEIGNAKTIRFDWQRGETRGEEIEVTRPDGTKFTVVRPCGHPSFQEIETVPDTTIFGATTPMSDEELADANAASDLPHDSAPFDAEPQPTSTPVNPGTHGVSYPMTDDELDALNPKASPRHGTPDQPDDPTKWAGIL